MVGPDPAVAATRLAVRRFLRDLEGPRESAVAAETGTSGPDQRVVLVACSGGADSLALLAACVFEARERADQPRGWRVIGVTVDHGLQQGSDRQAARVVAQMDALGVDETFTARVQVSSVGHGLEAAARTARYAVLEEIAARTGAAAVLLGHTLDDQAETVLLGLTRGSGGRSLAGMRRTYASATTTYSRPLLDLRRSDTEAACAALGLDFWVDPHNSDPRFLRSRVRRDVLPVLERQLGPGVSQTLARTADSLRLDMEALDQIADAELSALSDRAGAVAVQGLLEAQPAVRRRVLRQAALRAGALDGELFHTHVLAMEALVMAWRGQKWVDLPGHLKVLRQAGLLVFERADSHPAVPG